VRAGVDEEQNFRAGRHNCGQKKDAQVINR